MEFANLARTFEELERTSSRLTMIQLVTQLFSSIERPEEIQQVCYLMQGRVAPFYEALEMGMADKSVTKSIAQTSGKGAVVHKSARLADLLTQVDSVSAKYVVRILLGNLRMGIGDAAVLEALAKARWNDAKKRKLLEGAYHKTSDLGLIARTLWEHPGEDDAELAIAALDVQVGKPVHSQLAERLPTTEAIIARMGTVVAQYKYDGLRAQIHKD